MKKVDYIVVGCGLAGIAFCEQLEQHGKSFMVFDDQSQQSSVVAAGLYNPVILKRFTEAWKSKEQLALALPFYHNLENKLQVKLDHQLPIYRRFASAEEQNEWFIASDKPTLENYLSTQLIKNENSAVMAPYGFGKVRQTGRIDTATLLTCYKTFLKDHGHYCNESFLYDELNVKDNFLSYKDIIANYIVFAEGFGMVKNPFFKNLPLNVAKGEVITIRAPYLKIDYVLKSSVFVVPEGNDMYSVGATYNWKDKTHEVTKEAKNELVESLKQLIACEFEVVDQQAGIRPTVKDRRPLVGVHPHYKKVAILNGLGTRGVMVAPFVAKELFHHLEFGTPLESEIDIKRFKV
ncbi:MAG: FAD-dependent oxidoreductase [Gelidibacter sp.]